MRKEFPLEDQSTIDKDDEMFGRGGSIDFGNREANDAPKTISEADKDNTWQ
jgi:NADH-quinone oxidoreductase subunit C